MLSPDEGQVVLGGKDVSHARKREWTALRREFLVMVITIAVPHASTEGVTAYGITVEILPVLAGGARASRRRAARASRRAVRGGVYSERQDDA